jgi:hypothetical protein
VNPTERAAASRAEQGLPEHVDDPAVIARVIALVRAVAPATKGMAA